MEYTSIFKIFVRFYKYIEMYIYLFIMLLINKAFFKIFIFDFLCNDGNFFQLGADFLGTDDDFSVSTATGQRRIFLLGDSFSFDTHFCWANGDLFRHRDKQQLFLDKLRRLPVPYRLIPHNGEFFEHAA